MKAIGIALALGLGPCHGGGDSVPPKASAMPADRQCLPLSVCDKWTGCALVDRADADKAWTIVAAERFAPGDLVEVKNVCTTGDTCIGVRGVPRGVQCLPWSMPPRIGPPDYRCVWDGGSCRRD